MYLENILPMIIGILLLVIIVGFILRYLKQPLAIGYILIGALLGPYGFKFITNDTLFLKLGEIGVIFLLFFAGLEICFPCILRNWKIPILGTFLQILFSVGFIWLIGIFLGWSLSTILLLGFVISLSSTALILRILEDNKEINTKIGQNIIGILLIQDIAVILMLVIIRILGSPGSHIYYNVLKLLGGLMVIFGLYSYVTKKKVKLSFERLLKRGEDLQLYTALLICLGFAFISELLGLSAALGAFIAGVFISTTRDHYWIKDHLSSFRTIFIAIFFFSIGIMTNIAFLLQNLLLISIIVIIVFLLNIIINSISLRMLKESWKDSAYSAVILSQIGEFSFVLGTVGYQSKIIGEYSYQIIISVISLTLMFTPFLILIFKKLTGHNGKDK